MEHIFVYGSLRYGFDGPESRRLYERAFYRGPASAAGRLYNIDWYPGLIDPVHDTDRVLGDVYSVTDPAVLDWLDRYEEIAPNNDESGEYSRVRRQVFLMNAPTYAVREIEVWTYLYNWPLREDQRILSGDFLRFRDEHADRFPRPPGSRPADFPV